MIAIVPELRLTSALAATRALTLERPLLTRLSEAPLTLTDVLASVAESWRVRPPPKTLVAPVKVFGAVKVKVPAPALAKARAPLMPPPKVELAEALLTRLAAAALVMIPA